LFYAIPVEATVPGFEPGILLFVIIGTSLIMTGGMIRDKKLAAASLTPEEIEAASEAEAAYIMESTTDLSDIENSIDDNESID